MLALQCWCLSSPSTLNPFLEPASPSALNSLWRYTQKPCRRSWLSLQASSAQVQTAPTGSVLGHLWKEHRKVSIHGTASIPLGTLFSDVLLWAAAIRNSKFHSQSMMSKTWAQWCLKTNWSLPCWYVRWASDFYSKVFSRFAYDWASLSHIELDWIHNQIYKVPWPYIAELVPYLIWCLLAHADCAVLWVLYLSWVCILMSSPIHLTASVLIPKPYNSVTVAH